MPDQQWERAARKRFAVELSRVFRAAERRHRKPISKQRLASRIHVSKSSVYAYLNGGTRPGAEVLDRMLHEIGATPEEMRMLAGLLEASDPCPADAPSVPATRPPRGLPPSIDSFTGRDSELRLLDGLLGPRASGLVVVAGGAGMGKTALAVRWAHRSSDRYPDGTLFADLRGHAPDGQVDAREVLHGFLESLGVPPTSVPAALDARISLYRSLLRDRRMLILLDNARTADHARPLLPGSPGSAVIVTSRDRLEGLVVREGAQQIILGVLSPQESLGLLRRRLGAQPVEAEQSSIQELAELCAHLPLALGVAAARILPGPRPVATFVAKLREQRLDALGSSDAELDPRTLFRTSVAQLPEAAARLFHLLGLHPGPRFDRYACAALLGGSATAAGGVLRTLADAHLVTEYEPGRFGMHDLLHAVARESFDGGRREALGRLLDYHLSTSVRAAALIRPGRPDELPPPGPPWPAPSMGGYEEAMGWFVAEFPTLRTMALNANADGFGRHAWGLAWALTAFTRRTGRLSERVDLHRAAVAATSAGAERAVHAVALRLLADALGRVGKVDEARDLLAKSLNECLDLGDLRGILQIHLSHARLDDSADDHESAVRHAERALTLAPRIEDPMAMADSLAAVAIQRDHLHSPDDALILAGQALALYRAHAHAEGEALVLRIIGTVHSRSQRVPEAINALEHSVSLNRSLGDVYWEAFALERLAVLYAETGQPARAHECVNRARRLRGCGPVLPAGSPSASSGQDPRRPLHGWGDGQRAYDHSPDPGTIRPDS